VQALPKIWLPAQHWRGDDVLDYLTCGKPEWSSRNPMARLGKGSLHIRWRGMPNAPLSFASNQRVIAIS